MILTSVCILLWIGRCCAVDAFLDVKRTMIVVVSQSRTNSRLGFQVAKVAYDADGSITKSRHSPSVSRMNTFKLLVDYFD